MIDLFKRRLLSDFRWSLTLIDMALAYSVGFVLAKAFVLEATAIDVFQEAVHTFNVGVLVIFSVMFIEYKINAKDKDFRRRIGSLVDTYVIQTPIFAAAQVFSLLLDYHELIVTGNVFIKAIVIIAVLYVGIFSSIGAIILTRIELKMLFSELVIKACSDGDTSFLRTLLKKMPDINAGHVHGSQYSPLKIAVERGNLKVVDFLIDQGADPYRAVEGESAIDYLSRSADRGMIAHLKERYAAKQEMDVLVCKISTDIQEEGFSF